MSVISLGQLVQVAQRATDLDASVSFYQDVLGARLVGKFVPPGIALLEIGGVRLLLEADAQPATLYFRIDNLDAAYAALSAQSASLEGTPHLVHRDTSGQFGAPGEEEWMTFVRDPNDNLIGLIERRPAQA